MEPNKCRCGKRPDVFTQIDTRGKYRGIVECSECGEQVFGYMWCWDKDDAADDAVEEWNKKMPKVEGEDEDDD